ncbi:MAG: 50S ribosomal protein L21e [Candidatus Thermoplasmatota archaeon]
MKRSKGTRQGTRKILRKDPTKRGLIPINKALQEFEEGEKVKIKIEPSVHKGQPHRRFHGEIGEIEGKQGDAFVVKVKDGGKTKKVITRAEHLERAE